MILKRVKVEIEMNGYTNCYIVKDERTCEAMVIDPGSEPEKIISMIEAIDADVKYIYLTHCHGDHVGAVNEIKNKYDASVLIHRDDQEGLKSDGIALATYIGMDFEPIEDSCRVDENDIIHVGDLEFKVIHTPGHTKGSSSLYCEKEKMLFSGDTIFRGTWGRTDLPTSSFTDIISSITNKILVLPEDTIIYPGHGKSTMVREERPIYEELKPRID